MGVAEDFAPSFVKKPQLHQEDDGNRLIFECQLLSSPKPDIEWFRSDNKVVEDVRTKFKIQPVGENKYTVVLELDDVVETDAGLYKVKAKNKSGEVSASINLNFSPADEPKEKQIDGFAPTFAKKPAIRQEEDGKRLLFECRVNADPIPAIIWFHNGAAVKESERHKITVDKDVHSYFATLEILNVTVEDAGKYKVNAKNELGESNATISLNFDSDEAPVPESAEGIKPTFTERPVIRQSEDGGNVTFECRCVGDPTPTVTWSHGETELNESNRYKMSLTMDQKLYHIACLEIGSVVSSDQGEYRAQAKNKHGSGVATINLNFESGSKKIPDGKSPRFPKKPTIRQEEDLLIMECVLEAHPVPDIVWYCSEKEICNNQRTKMTRKAITKDSYILTLEIQNPTKEDGGNYRCNAINMYGESNANIALNFQGASDANGFAPSFIEKPRIIPNESGTLITMKCKCKAKPEPTVTWYRGQDLVEKSKKIKINTTVIAEDTYELTLEIKDPGATDGGTYRCNVKNEYGESNANLNLNIEAEPEPEGEGPTFIEKPRIVSENNGKLVIMECKVKADPKPDVIWFRNGEVIKESNKIKTFIEQRGDQYYIKLELLDPQLEDSGLYKCNIKNTLGELNANLTLNIEIVPVIKDKPKIIKIIKKRTVVIECTVASKFEPKCTWYKETSSVKESKRHVYLVEQTKEGEFAVKLEINDVEESDKGAYKLVASNEKGEAVSQIVNLVDIPEEERKPCKPEISRKLADQKVAESKTFELIVSLSQSDRKCKVEWYKGSTVIRETKDITTTFDGTTARLTFSSARTEHTSNYKVIVTNEVGKDESSCKITVEKGGKKKEEKPKEKEKTKNEKEVEQKEMEEDKNPSDQSVAQTEGRSNVEQINKGDPEEELTEKKEILDKKDAQEVKESSAELQDSAGHELPEPKKPDQSHQKNSDKMHKSGQSESESKTNKNESTAEPIKTNKQDSGEQQATEQIGLKKVDRKASIVSVKEEISSDVRRKSTIKAKEEITVDDKKASSRRSSLAVEESNTESRRSSIIDKKPLEQVDNKPIDANKNPQPLKEEIPRLKPAEKRRTSKVLEEPKPDEGLPKLRKASIAQVKEEAKPAAPKLKAKAKAKPKYEELPEIPDYERPQLEKYEKSDFTPSDFARDLEIPNKMEKPIIDSGKKEPAVLAQKNGIPKKTDIIEQYAEEPKGLKVGKGKQPDEGDGRDGAVLKPVIIEPEKEILDLGSKEHSEHGNKPTVLDIIKQRRRSSIRNLMTKEPIQNESFLGVVLKPVIKDAREQAAPQQAIQLTKANATEQFSPTKAVKAQVADLKKPETLATLEDNYERPVLEKYDPFSIDKTKSEKLTPSIITPDTKGPEVMLPVQETKEEKQKVPKMQPPAPGDPPKIEVIREKRPSLAPEPPSRRGSLIPPADTGRRPSLIINDEKKLRPGEVMDTRLLRPGEVGEGQRRRPSIDVRRPSVQDLEDLINKPSTPLRDVGDGGPPSIVDVQESYSVVEDSTAYLTVGVEGSPAPTFKFYKGVSEILEGGRFKFLTDGQTNTITLCMRKCKPNDESKYKIVVSNIHGEDSAEMQLYVSDSSGMDFRAMLKKRRYQKWDKDEQDPNWGDLKETEKPLPALKKVERKVESFLSPLIDQFAKEGKDKKVVFEARFSKPNCKPKWLFRKDEVFTGSKFKFKQENDTYQLIITTPKVEDTGKYTIEIGGVSSTAFLNVEEADPTYTFTKPLKKKLEGFTQHETTLECSVSSSMANVHWFKDNTKLESDDPRYLISKDINGNLKLIIKDSVLDDAGLYRCQLDKQPDKTECNLKVTEYPYKFVKVLKSQQCIEKDTVTLACEIDDAMGEVKWFRNGEEIKPDKRIQVVKDGRKRKLVIKDCKVTDAGQFKCTTNADTTESEIVINYQNRFNKKLKDTEAVEREKLVLDIELQDQTAPCDWKFNGEPIVPSESIEIKNIGGGKHQLIFNSLDMSNEGEITCESGQLSSKCKLSIRKGESRPNIDCPDKFAGPISAPVLLEVPFKVSGTKQTPVEAKLFKDGKPLPVKDVEVAVTDDKVTFKIKKPSRDLSGPYQIKISNGQGEDTKDVQIICQDVPQPPQDVDITDVYQTSCVVSFNPPSDDGGTPITKYVIERQDLSKKHGWESVAEVIPSEPCLKKIDDLIPKKQYRFRIRAVNAIGQSDPATFKNTILAKDPWDEPGKPKAVDLTDWDKDHADLKWDAPETDGGDPITAYIVEYKEKFSNDWVAGKEVDGDARTATVDGLKEGQQYEFRVRAVNRAGPGEPSDKTKSIIAKCRFVKPFIVGEGLKNVTVKKGQTIRFDIKYDGEPEPAATWVKGTDNLKFDNQRISLDQLERNSSITIKKSVRKDTGKYKLVLSNSSGTIESEAQVVVLDRPLAPGGPFEPEEIRASHIKMKWNRPEDDGGCEISGYALERMDEETGRWIPAGEVGPNETSFDFKGLTPNKKYKFRVKAINKEGESEPLETFDAIVARNPYDPPSPPSQPIIDDYDNKSVLLKWKRPPSDGGRPITHYIVEIKDKFAPSWSEVARTDDPNPECNVEGLKEKMVYQFRVRAVNKAGPSEPSQPTDNHLCKHKNLKPQIDRSTFKRVTIKSGRTHKWSVDVLGEPIPELHWSWRDDIPLTNGDRIKIENIDYHTDFSITNVLRKDSGFYTLKAENRNGIDRETVELVVLGKPSSPKGPLAVSDVTANGCKLQWKKPEDDGGVPIKEYVVEKMDTATGKWVRVGRSPGEKEPPSFDVTGLNLGSEYMFRVSAVNEEGESEPLTTLVGVVAKDPFDEPNKPGTPEVTDYDNQSVSLKWAAPNNDGGAPIQKYIIEKKNKNKTEWEKALEIPGDQLEATVAGLQEYGEYQFRVIAVNKAGLSPPSDSSVPQIVKYKKLKPRIDRSNLKPLLIRAGKPIKYDVNVRGEPAPVITWYQNDKELKPEELPSSSEIKNIPYNTKISIIETVRKHTGIYKIKAVNEHGQDEATVEVNILAPPSKPRGPLDVKDVTKDSCKLKWKKPEDDGGKPISAYQVEKFDKKQGRWVPLGRTSANDTEFDVKGLQEGHEYQFRVKAINEEGESDPLDSDDSIIAKNPYDAASKPGTPNIGDYNEHMVKLKWEAPRSDGGAPISGYVIEKKDKFSPIWDEILSTNTSVPEATVEGLVEGNIYQFRVRAVNKAGLSDPSDATEPHLAKPRNLKPYINRDKMKPIKVRAGQPVKFDVDVKGEPAPSLTWFLKETELTPTGQVRLENIDYNSKLTLLDTNRKQSGQYKLRAENINGVDEAEVEVIILDKPSKPEGPIEVSDIHKEGCKLKWKKPKDDGGIPITGYVIEKMDTATGKWVPAGSVDPEKYDIEIKGLDPNHRYQFRVKAVNEEGESEPLETESAITAKNPFDVSAPPGLPELEDWDEHHVKLKWEPPIRDGGSPITNYIIEVMDKDSGEFVKAVETDSPVCKGVVKKLEEGQQYKFRVRAVNKAGPSDPSEQTNWHVAKPRFLKPHIDRMNLKPVIVKTGLSISLDINIRGEPAPKVEWFFNKLSVTSDEHSVKIDNVDYNTKFFVMRAQRSQSGKYTIKATNEVGEDEAELEVTVLGKPGKPKGPLQVNDITKHSCKLKWEKPDDDGGSPIDYYEIEKLDPHTGQWLPCGKSTEPEAKVIGLHEGKAYKFRVRAVNKEGESEDLETEKPIIAKNPFDEPDRPGKPEPTNWDKDFVDLAWDPPKNDGGAPIQKYIIQMRDKSGRAWVDSATVPGDKCNGTVTGVEEGHEYEFRIVAVNKAGPSDPSDVSKSVIAKPRFLKPHIDRKNLQKKIMRSGQMLHIDALIKAEPPAKITWTYNETEIKTSDHIKIENEDYKTTFIMPKVKRADRGIYIVTAKNDSGSDTVEVELEVLCKPSKPKGPSSCF
ncbi:GM26811 [Drosophila sechellia]|uniref:GM26811 n=1 Tax=Drosophila sechellia TaxID=7238 RepID=B4IIY6_DROSE|nr:GM26811 [Drosophila sechellia]